MKTDRTGAALIGLAVALIVLSAGIGTVVIDDVVSAMPVIQKEWHGVDDYRAASAGYWAQSEAAIGMSAVVTGSLVLSAGLLLGFVLLRSRMSVRDDHGNEVRV